MHVLRTPHSLAILLLCPAELALSISKPPSAVILPLFFWHSSPALQVTGVVTPPLGQAGVAR